MSVGGTDCRVGDRVRVWCLRHAESESVPAGRAGAEPSAPLTARGRLQAIAAAQVLAAEPIARIYASTALRARQTAEFLAATPGLAITAVPELAEVRCTAAELRAWVIEQDLGRRAADGETGEQVVARVTAAVRQIAGAHAGETVAVVGHVASLTVALGRLCSLGPVVWGTPLPHARPFLVEWDDQTWQCPEWPTLRQPLPHANRPVAIKTPDPHDLTIAPVPPVYRGSGRAEGSRG